MSLDNLKPIVEASGKLKEEIDRLTRQKTKLDAEIREALLDKGVKVFGSYQVEVVSVAGRKTLDTKRLAEVVKDLDTFYKVGAPSTRMTMKVVDVV